MKTLHWFILFFVFSIFLAGMPPPAQAEYPYDDDVTLEPTVDPVDVRLEVDSTNKTGAKFVAPADGTYKIAIAGGAFCYLPQDSDSWALFGGWATGLLVYENQPVKWGAVDKWGKHPVDATTTVGLGDHSPTVAAAEAAAKGSSVTIDLKKGDYIMLVVSDGYDYYSDNSGIVTVRVTGP